jgi:hypothetical protein
MAAMQSQHDWIIWQQSLSPDEHMTVTPLAVYSTLHMAMTKWQVHTGRPFIIMQQPHIDSAIDLQRLCKVLLATSLSHSQTILQPSLVFSIFMVQRGTIMAGIPTPGAGIVGEYPVIVGIAPIMRSMVIEPDMTTTPCLSRRKSLDGVALLRSTRTAGGDYRSVRF